MGLNLVHLNKVCVKWFNQSDCVSCCTLVVCSSKACKIRPVFYDKFRACTKTASCNDNCACTYSVFTFCRKNLYTCNATVISLYNLRNPAVVADFRPGSFRRLNKNRNKVGTDCSTALRPVGTLVCGTSHLANIRKVCTQANKPVNSLC